MGAVPKRPKFDTPLARGNYLDLILVVFMKIRFALYCSLEGYREAPQSMQCKAFSPGASWEFGQHT